MKISSRLVSLVLLGIVMLLVASSLLSLLTFSDAAMEAMSPGDPLPRRWRLVAMQLLAVSIIAGVLAFDRVRRGDERLSIFAPGSAALAALGLLAAARMTGIKSAFQLSIIFCLAVAGMAGWTVYRDRQSTGEPRFVTGEATRIWLAAILQAVALFFLLALSDEAHWPERPLRALLLATPQWIVAWRFGAVDRLSRGDAGAATALGVAGIVALVLFTFFPVAYVGFLGLALLRTGWGIAFYAVLGAGSWLFLRAGASLRTRLTAPARDRKIAILAGFLGVPLLITLGVWLRRLLP